MAHAKSQRFRLVRGGRRGPPRQSIAQLWPILEDAEKLRQIEQVWPALTEHQRTAIELVACTPPEVLKLVAQAWREVVA